MARVNVLITCVLAAVLAIAMSAAAKDGATGPAESGNALTLAPRTNVDDLYITAPGNFDTFSTDSGALFKMRRETLYRRGPFDVVLDGGSYGAFSTRTPFASPFGAPFGTDVGYTSVTWRYHGLFGGVVRPVMRMTGAGGTVALPADMTASAFDTGRFGMLVPEAGVEIVYKGYGLGMTVSYPLVNAWDGTAADVTGHFPDPRDRPDGVRWEDLWKNVYLIVE
ncbi:hypothetical protein K8I61_02285 [bacterium]|nr:hypothetical protein [bacterium]